MKKNGRSYNIFIQLPVDELLGLKLVQPDIRFAKLIYFFGFIIQSIGKKTMKVYNAFIVVLSTYLLTAKLLVLASDCKLKFEGFGVFLGSNDHFGRSKPGTEAKVLHMVYESLGIR